MWKRIEEFPDYEVSDDGRVRSFRQHQDGRKGARDLPYEMSGHLISKRYRAVILRKPGSNRPYSRTIHRLVAKAFIPNPENLSDVAHCDGDPLNNRAANLRWSTHRENQMDMRHHGTMQDGERCITAKLTSAQVAEIRARIAAEGRGSQRRLAAEFRVSVAQISRIANRKRWAGA